jgi:hypothetical protein
VQSCSALQHAWEVRRMQQGAAGCSRLQQDAATVIVQECLSHQPSGSDVAADAVLVSS